METSTENVTSELYRRQKATATTVVSLLIGVVLLSVLAYVSRKFIPPQNSTALDGAVRITILIFGLGAIVLRRTRFTAMRLQDIAGLKGSSGLLITLQRTTIQVALLATVIAIVGFIATLLSGNPFYSYGGGIVAVAVLLYSYPTRRQWQRTLQRFAPEGNPSQSE